MAHISLSAQNALPKDMVDPTDCRELAITPMLFTLLFHAPNSAMHLCSLCNGYTRNSTSMIIAKADSRCYSFISCWEQWRCSIKDKHHKPKINQQKTM